MIAKSLKSYLYGKHEDMPYNPTTIANYFIEKYAGRGKMTPMKVIQLTYLAYGWYLAINNKKRLTDESPIAWDFGPCFSSLFFSLKAYGKLEIKRKLPNLVGNSRIASDDKHFLDQIWNIYGRFEGSYLCRMIQRKDTALKKAYSKEGNLVISDADLYEYYKNKMQTAQSSN
jgi:uncharacterized phage-associated protein